MLKLRMSTAIFDLIYPVGSIYLSANNTNPGTLFGGTWEQISQGRTLVGQGVVEANTDDWCGHTDAGAWTAYAGLMGGEVSHTLALTEAPAHRHSLSLQVHNGGGSKGSVYGITNFTSGWDTFSRSTPGTSGYLRWGMDSQGGGGAHNNLPPYLVVYIWKRTA
jgi:microcystin-dependent protein